MRSHRRGLAALFIGLGSALFVALIVAGGTGARAAQPTPPGEPPPGHQTAPPIYTIPPELLQTAPPVVAPTAAPTPTPTPVPTAVPTTGPAVGTEVTPPGLVSVPVASVGPAPQPSSQDPTLVILVVIIGLGLLAIGAFVLAISVQ